MAGIQSHMFLSKPFSEEKFEPPFKKPTNLGGGGGWGGLGLGLAIFFFVRALRKTCLKSQILSTSLRKNVKMCKITCVEGKQAGNETAKDLFWFHLSSIFQ